MNSIAAFAFPQGTTSTTSDDDEPDCRQRIPIPVNFAGGLHSAVIDEQVLRVKGPYACFVHSIGLFWPRSHLRRSFGLFKYPFLPGYDTARVGHHLEVKCVCLQGATLRFSGAEILQQRACRCADNERYHAQLRLKYGPRSVGVFPLLVLTPASRSPV